MLPVKSVMTTQVVTVHPETPIFEALQLLSSKQISGVPVVNTENEVVGILSEKDVLRILVDKTLTGNKVVNDYMSKDVIAFKEDDSASDVCKFFINSHIRRVPIVRDGKIVGIVSRRDIVELILDYKSKMSEFRLA